jgi:hypothetical protein
MGRENQSNEKLSNAGLRGILFKNLVEWGGANTCEADVIADAWLAPGNTDWEEYFMIRERLAASRPLIPASLVAEEDYTLLHRAASFSPDCAVKMLKIMREGFARRYSSLPQPRTLLSRVMGGF